MSREADSIFRHHKCAVYSSVCVCVTEMFFIVILSLSNTLQTNSSEINGGEKSLCVGVVCDQHISRVL